MSRSLLPPSSSGVVEWCLTWSDTKNGTTRQVGCERRSPTGPPCRRKRKLEARRRFLPRWSALRNCQRCLKRRKSGRGRESRSMLATSAAATTGLLATPGSKSAISCSRANCWVRLRSARASMNELLACRSHREYALHIRAVGTPATVVGAFVDDEIVLHRRCSNPVARRMAPSVPTGTVSESWAAPRSCEPACRTVVQSAIDSAREPLETSSPPLEPTARCGRCEPTSGDRKRLARADSCLPGNERSSEAGAAAHAAAAASQGAVRRQNGETG